MQRLVGLALMLCLTACDQQGPESSSLPMEAPKSSSSPDRYPADHPAAVSALAAIQSEPSVIDAFYDPDLVVPWTIGVADDGTPRHGLAEYFCMVIADSIPYEQGYSVRIVDHQEIMSNGGDFRAASLGHVECGSGRNLGI